MVSDEEIESIIKSCHTFYNDEYKKLKDISTLGEGKARKATQTFVENFLQFIIDCITNRVPKYKIESRVGSKDFLSLTIDYKNKTYINDKIQVDRHLYVDNMPLAFIENKTYLDSCYLDRTLSDFKKIIHSLYQRHLEPADYGFVVFAGQNCCSENKLYCYEAELYNSVKDIIDENRGLDIHYFFFLKGKRDSKTPIYKQQYELDDDVIKEFIKFFIRKIEKSI